MGDIIQLTPNPVRVPAAASGTNGKVLSDPKDMIDVSAYDAVDLEVSVYSGSGNVGSLTLYSSMTVPKEVDQAPVVLTAATISGNAKTIVTGLDSGKALLRYLGWKLENSSGGDIAVSVSGIARRGG